jgi:hypothetical protein
MGGKEDWGLSPLGWGFVFVTAGVELGSIAGRWRPLAVLGWVHVRPSAVPVAFLLIVLGPRLFSGTGRWLPFYALTGVLAAVPAAGFLDLFGGGPGLAGFALSALQEEVVFRAALPLAVWWLLDRAGTGPRLSRAGAILVAASVFAILPNHLQQATPPLGVFPFIAFAVLFSLLVRRPNALLPAALAHLAINVLSVPVLHGGVSPAARGLAVAVLLAAFALTVDIVNRTPAPAPVGPPAKAATTT